MVLTRRFKLALVLFLAGFVGLSVMSLTAYGGLSYWPSLASQFGASFLAFVIALRWEWDREQAALERAAKQTNEARAIEARKRLLALQAEFDRNSASIEMLAETLPLTPGGPVDRLLHPELLDGAWTASGARLGDLIADYDLIAMLATFYGRLEELRWRIRHRTQTRDTHLDSMTRGLAGEMRDELANLRDRIASELATPQVRVVGLVHVRSIGPATATDTAVPLE